MCVMRSEKLEQRIFSSSFLFFVYNYYYEFLFLRSLLLFSSFFSALSTFVL